MVANQGCVRLTKVSLVAGGRDVIVYTTISGAVGALIPFVSMDDVEFMTTLEMVSNGISAGISASLSGTLDPGGA